MFSSEINENELEVDQPNKFEEVGIPARWTEIGPDHGTITCDSVCIKRAKIGRLISLHESAMAAMTLDFKASQKDTAESLFIGAAIFTGGMAALEGISFSIAEYAFMSSSQKAAYWITVGDMLTLTNEGYMGYMRDYIFYATYSSLVKNLGGIPKMTVYPAGLGKPRLRVRSGGKVNLD